MTFLGEGGGGGGEGVVLFLDKYTSPKYPDLDSNPVLKVPNETHQSFGNPASRELKKLKELRNQWP